MKPISQQLHPEVMVCEYKGIPVRFRIVDDCVYVPVTDVTRFLMSHTFYWQDMFSTLNTMSKVIFYQSGKCLWSIESPDILPLAKMTCRWLQKENVQSRIKWLTDKMYELKEQKKRTDKKNKDMESLQVREQNELIKITEQNGKRAVSARELHRFLASKQEFANWIKKRIEKYGFVENQDYEVFDNFVKNPNGGRPLIEYALSVNMAKELAMIEGNEQGKQARQYFITCEKKLRESNIPSYQIDDQIKRAERWIEERKQLRIAEQKACELQEENDRKSSIIEGLVSEIPLADMRQRITQIIRKANAGNVGKGYHLLYNEFNAREHINVFTRMNNIGYKGNTMDYIEKELGKLPDLYDLTCKLFENTYDDLMKSWGKSARHAECQRNLANRQKYII